EDAEDERDEARPADREVGEGDDGGAVAIRTRAVAEDARCREADLRDAVLQDGPLEGLLGGEAVQEAGLGVADRVGDALHGRLLEPVPGKEGGRDIEDLVVDLLSGGARHADQSRPLGTTLVPNASTGPYRVGRMRLVLYLFAAVGGVAIAVV